MRGMATRRQWSGCAPGVCGRTVVPVTGCRGIHKTSWVQEGHGCCRMVVVDGQPDACFAAPAWNARMPSWAASLSAPLGRRDHVGAAGIVGGRENRFSTYPADDGLCASAMIEVHTPGRGSSVGGGSTENRSVDSSILSLATGGWRMGGGGPEQLRWPAP